MELRGGSQYAWISHQILMSGEGRKPRIPACAQTAMREQNLKSRNQDLQNPCTHPSFDVLR